MLDRCSSQYIGFRSMSVLLTKLLYWHINLTQLQHHHTSQPSYDLWHLRIRCGLWTVFDYKFSALVLSLAAGPSPLRHRQCRTLYQTSCAARWPPQYAPAPWPWLMTLKSVCESHVTWGTPVQSFVFLGLLVGFRVRADVRDIRQTDDGCRSPLNAPGPPTGRGHNKLRLSSSLSTFKKHFVAIIQYCVHVTVSFQRLCIFTTLWCCTNPIIIIIIYFNCHFYALILLLHIMTMYKAYVAACAGYDFKFVLFAYITLHGTVWKSVVTILFSWDCADTIKSVLQVHLIYSPAQMMKALSVHSDKSNKTEVYKYTRHTNNYWQMREHVLLGFI